MPKPVTSQTLAQTAPVFIPGCTQFLVEFTGDYLNQDPATGAIIGTYMDTTVTPNVEGTTDGKIDFVQIGTGATMRREIRWYGMPRDIDSDGVIIGGASAEPIMRASRDVVPLRDYWQLVGTQATTCAPFEKAMIPLTGSTIIKQANYADVTGTGANGMQLAHQYRCAWGPNDRMPEMIRITIVIDDPDGRLPGTDGQTFEYVYSLP